jgi:hypothetical protein
MDPVELSDDGGAAQQAGAGARARGIDSVEKGRREVEGPGETPRAERGQVAEEDQNARERWDQDEAEEDMEEHLAVCPAGVVAGLGPTLLRNRGCHDVKLATRVFEVGSQESTLCLNVGLHFPTKDRALR